MNKCVTYEDRYKQKIFISTHKKCKLCKRYFLRKRAQVVCNKCNDLFKKINIYRLSEGNPMMRTELMFRGTVQELEYKDVDKIIKMWERLEQL